jgi:hypothetical protein
MANLFLIAEQAREDPFHLSVTSSSVRLSASSRVPEASR